MPGLQEYVLRLSTDVDNVGVQKLFSLLDTNKMKALGLTAALTAATTAVYKWVESATKEEIALQKLSKEKHKSIEQTRAEQEALKQMGMTLNDIKKDKALKSIYDDLVKFNKEMQMPNAAHAIGKVRELQGAFWKLKSAVSYLVQSIGSQLLINLEKPIERITNKLNKGANWIKNNLTSIGTKITGYLTAFSKGIIGIVEGVGKIFNWLGQMPEGIKSIAGTLATVFALIKSGPIGQIFALITAAGDLIHDFENSQWNKENKENTTIWNDGKGGWTDKKTEFGAYQVPLMYENLWNFLENDTGTLREKAKTITLSILEGIKDALAGFTDTLNNGQGLTEWLESLTGPVGDILGGIQDTFSSSEGQTAIAGVLTEFFTTAASLCKAGGKFGSQIFGSVAGMIANVFGAKDIWEDSNVKKAFEGDNGFANGLMATIETALIGGNWWESILTGVMGGYQTEREKAIKNLYKQDHPGAAVDWSKVVWGENGIPSYTELESMYGKDSRLAQMLGSGVQESFNTFIAGILEMLVGGINIASDVAGNILNTIIQAVIQGILAPGDQGIADNVSEALNSEGAKDVMDSIGAGIGTWIMSGNFFAGILGSVVSFISQSIETAKTTNMPLWDVMKDKVSDFWDSIQDIIYGPLLDPEGDKNGPRAEELGLASVIKPLLWGAVDEYEQAFDEVTGEHFKARKGGILNWLLGYDAQKTDAAGNEIEGEVHRVKGIFEKAWEGEDGQGGIKSFFAGIANKIGEWLEPVGTAITSFFDGLWIKLFNNMPGWITSLLGFSDPNQTEVVDNGDGTFTIRRTTGEEYKAGAEAAETAQEIGLEATKGKTAGGALGIPTVEIPGGLVPEGFQEDIKAYRGTARDAFDAAFIDTIESRYASSMAAAAEANDTRAMHYLNSLYTPGMGTDASAWTQFEQLLTKYQKSGVPEEYTAPTEGVENMNKQSEGASGSIEEMSTAAKNSGTTLENFDTQVDLAASKAETLGDKVKGASLDLQEASDHFGTVGNSLESITGNAGSASESMGALASGASHAAGVLASLSAGSGTPGAMGGRFDTPTEKRIGEAGTEYLIPATKPERAFSLVLQLLTEMGGDMIKRVISHFGGAESSLSEGISGFASSAASRVGKDFSLGTGGTIGGSMGSLETALQNMQQNYNYNISAPVSIIVNSNANAEDVGRAAYSAAERSLMKTLRGAWA